MTGTSTSRTMSGTARAASSLLTVTRTSSLPASASARTWVIVPGDVGRVGVGHRLDDDRVGAAHLDAAHVHRHRTPALEPRHPITDRHSTTVAQYRISNVRTVPGRTRIKGVSAPTAAGSMGREGTAKSPGCHWNLSTTSSLGASRVIAMRL